MGIINFASFDLQGEDKTSDEYISVNVFYRWAPTFGDAKVGYRVVSKNKLKLDRFIGTQINFAKMTYTLNTEIHGTASDSKNDFSIEPIIAARLTYIPHYRLEFMGYIDYGVFRSGEELTNQYKTEATFLITKWLYFSSGYKHWIYRKNKKESIFNGKLYGFYAKLGVQF